MDEDRIEMIGSTLEEKGLSHAEIDRYFLEHYGVKGMKWGVRRHTRAERYARVGRGEGTRTDKLRTAVNLNAIDIVRGRGNFKKAAAAKGTAIQARLERIAKGEATVRDRLADIGTLRYADLIPVKTK